MTAATIYCRVSLDASGEGAAVERQERECRELCEARGWTVDRVLVDNSVSATSGAARPAFVELLRLRPERVVVWHTDRLVRLTSDLEKVLDAGLEVFAVTAGHLDLSTPAGRAVARTVTAWATFETEQKGVRQRAGHRQRREAGRPFWTRRPFGYELDGTLREDEAEELRQAYQAIRAGASINGVARDWNARGIRTTETKSKPEGGTWRASSVRQLVLHPRNIGKATRSLPGGGVEELPHEGTWTPLVDLETFRAVQRELAAPGRRVAASTKRKGLLTGLLYCGSCDEGMRLFTLHQRGKVYRYYNCTLRCGAWPVEWLEEHLAETALALLQSPDYMPRQDDAPDSEELAALEAEHDRLGQLVEELLEDRREGLLTRAQWRQEHEATRAKLADVEARLEELRATSTAPGLEGLDRAGLLAYWEGLEDTDARREVLRHLFGEVTCQPRGRGSRSEPDRELLTFARNDWANRLALRVIHHSA